MDQKYRTVQGSVIEGYRSENVNVECEGKNKILRIYNTCPEPITILENQILMIKEEQNDDQNREQHLKVNRKEMTLDMINFGKEVTTEQKHEVFELLQEYRDCFALSLGELGCTNVLQMNIVDNNVPVRSLPYKTSAKDRVTIAELVNQLKECGLVTETTSPYASPVLLVRKKNGDPRLVVDFRKLNKQTVKTNFPVPGIDEQFQHLAGCNIFVCLDLANGYMQVPLTPEACQKTAFITPDTTGEFKRMCFGLTNAPYEFVKLMNIVLGPLRNTICCCYLDDVIIPGKSWQQLLERLKLVLEAFRKASLTLNLNKCEFGKKEITYLGYTISEKGLTPGLRKSEAVEQFPVPLNVHEVRRFLGLTGFFRRFVPKYAEIAKPLTDLTKKGNVFNLTDKCLDSFKSLKDSLAKPPILKLYDANAETELHTDASAIGIAGLLLQKDIDGRMRLVYCVSKKTTEAESKYHSSRLELMAIVWCVERLRLLLIGIRFKIITDCQAIVFLNSKKNINPQVARWFSVLQEYDYEIVHRKGERMMHADALSRAPVEDCNDTQDFVIEKRLSVLLTFTENEQVAIIQRSDEKLRRLMEILEKPMEFRTEEEEKLTKDYKMIEGKLCTTKIINGEEKTLFVVPNSMRKSIVVKKHDLEGHFSVDRTIEKIMECYWFSKMRRYVKRHIASCMECLVNKVPGGKKKGELHPIPPVTRPFERLHIDNLGPLPKSSRGYVHIMVIIDSFSRFVNLYPVKTTKTTAMLRSMEDFILKYGVPKTIVTDRGTCFTSDRWKQFCREKGIKHILTSPRHAQANGMVERVNRVILPVIQAEMTTAKNWDTCLKKVQFDLNTSINKTTRRTPFKILHGYNPSLDNARIRQLVETDKWDLPEDKHEQIRQEIENMQAKYKKQFDKKRYIGMTFDVGEVVVVKSNTESTGESTKLQQKYKGPYVVVEILPSDTYRIEKLKCDKDSRKQVTTAHVSQLKGYYNDNETEDESDQESIIESEREENEEHEKERTESSEEVENELQEEESEEKGDITDEVTRPKRSIKVPQRYLE